MLFLAGTLAGCGYTTRGFVATENTIIIEPVINTIEVTSQHSQTSGFINYPVLIENKLTSALVSRFNIDGNLKVVNKSQDSLSLNCTVVDYEKETLRFSVSDDVREQRLRLTVKMKLLDSKGELVRSRQIVGQTTYFLSGPHRKTESAAWQDLIDDTSRRILEAVVEAW